jgi:hypothetical protein
VDVSQKITYTNRTQGKLLVILEPWAEEYWIEPDQPVDIEVRDGSPGGHLEIEHTPKGLIVYGWAGTVVSLVRDGKEVPPSPQTPSNPERKGPS